MKSRFERDLSRVQCFKSKQYYHKQKQCQNVDLNARLGEEALNLSLQVDNLGPKQQLNLTNTLKRPVNSNPDLLIG